MGLITIMFMPQSCICVTNHHGQVCQYVVGLPGHHVASITNIQPLMTHHCFDVETGTFFPWYGLNKMFLFRY